MFCKLFLLKFVKVWQKGAKTMRNLAKKIKKKTCAIKTRNAKHFLGNQLTRNKFVTAIFPHETWNKFNKLLKSETMLTNNSLESWNAKVLNISFPILHFSASPPPFLLEMGMFNLFYFVRFWFVTYPFHSFF